MRSTLYAVVVLTNVHLADCGGIKTKTIREEKEEEGVCNVREVEWWEYVC